MGECRVCGGSTPDPPISAPDVRGEFCCEGCLATVREGESSGTASASSSDDSDELATTVLAVEGMHCATCESFLEDRATEVAGVVDADATYAAELVRVTHDEARVDTSTLVEALSTGGYTARPVDTDPAHDPDDTGRLLVGVLFTAMAMMWYVLFLYPAYLGVSPSTLLMDVSGPAGTYVLGMLWVFATAVLAYTGAPLFRSALVSLRARQPNVDLLVALAAGTAYLYSTVAVLVGRTEVYFDVAMVIVVVVTLGRAYERRMRRRASDALSELAAARVDSARRRTGSGIETVAVDRIESGDEVVVRPGEHIPVDGTVLEGVAGVDESLITGEGTPVRKEPGDDVVGGSIATDGELIVTPTEDAASTVDRLVEVLWEVQSERTGPQRIADRLAEVFVPAVIVIATVAGGWSLMSGSTPTTAFLTGLAVLVVSCPCALGLATPLAVASGLRRALDDGIVLTDRAAVERGADVDIVALDKTGTLTTGAMTVDAVYGHEETLGRAAAVEQFADHPIADAIAGSVAVDRGVEEVTRHPGMGASARVAGTTVTVGRAALFEDRAIRIPDRLVARYDQGEAAGKTSSYVAWEGEVRGVVVTGDAFRPGWQAVVEDLASPAERVVVLTGDSAAATAPLEAVAAIDEVISRVEPTEKASVVERFRDHGTVAFVGDGTNDAPALATADIGVAMGSGTDVAGDAADAVVVGDDLTAVPQVFAVTRATRRRVWQNLGWAFAYNAVAIPLAALGMLNPLFAAIAMSASSLLVVGNSARPLLEAGQSPEVPTSEPDAATRKDDGARKRSAADPRSATVAKRS